MLASDHRNLTDAFSTFSRVSAQLETSYRDLEQRIAGLNAELGEARRAQAAQAEENRRLAERLAELIAALPGGVVVLDAAGTIVDSNPAARDLIGDPLVGETWRNVATRTLQGVSRLGGEFTLANGRRVTLAERPLMATGGRIVLVSDITETSLVRELLERNKRLTSMGEMAAVLAHQVRTPLTAALLYASQVARKSLPGDERARFADKLIARLDDMERLVADMLAFTRGGGRPADEFSVSALMEQVAQCLEPRLARRARLTIRTLAPELKLRGNAQALAGALLNLANNSLDAGNEGLELVIEARRGERGVELRVRDNGPGVPEELRQRVFEPFFTTRSRGTGLGLAVVKAVAEAHGGTVELERMQAPGACFVLRLPELTTETHSGACA
jgi:two-component system sensor histidine kinase FlrB